jgi:hypothetical protein
MYFSFVGAVALGFGLNLKLTSIVPSYYRYGVLAKLGLRSLVFLLPCHFIYVNSIRPEVQKMDATKA